MSYFSIYPSGGLETMTFFFPGLRLSPNNNLRNTLYEGGGEKDRDREGGRKSKKVRDREGGREGGERERMW